LGGTPACSSDFNGGLRPRPQNDSDGNVLRGSIFWPSTWYPSHDVLKNLRIVQDRFWRTTSSTNLCSSLSLSLYSLSSVRPSSIYLHRRFLPPLQNRPQWTFWQCTRLIGILVRSNNQHSRQKSTTSMSFTRPSTHLSESPQSFVQTTLRLFLADLLENLALSFSPVSTATSKCVVFFPTHLRRPLLPNS